MEKNTEPGQSASSEPEQTLEVGPTRVAAITSIASGALVFAIAGIPSGAMAASENAPIKLDGQTLLDSLKRAGLDPKRLDLAQLLGKRADLAELQARLTGTAPGTETAGPGGVKEKKKGSGTTWNVTIFAYNA